MKNSNKKLYTSNFTISGKDKNAIAISIGVPKWYNGKRYLPLAPTWDMVMNHKNGKITDRQYTIQYNKILRKLNAKEVIKNLTSGSILLCWESPEDFCHRRLVAKWLEKETGIVVPELSMHKLENLFEL